MNYKKFLNKNLENFYNKVNKGMDLYFFHHNDYERLYNCSIYNIDQIPLEKRQHKILGIFVISLSTIYEVSLGEILNLKL